MIKLTSLKPNKKNPRKIKDEAFNKLCDNLKRFPEMLKYRGIVVDDTNTILGGNQRYKALLALGYKEIPDEWVQRADELSEAQKREFVIVDNTQAGDWDRDALKDYDPIDLENYGLQIDWPTSDMGAKEDDYVPPKKITTDIKEGDYIELGRHRLMCGDSLNPENVARLMEGREADLMITDPPYNVSYVGGTEDHMEIQNDSLDDKAFEDFLLKFLNTAKENLKKGGPFYVFSPAGNTETTFRNQINKSELMLKQSIVWVKNALVLGRQDYHWIHESILYGWKPGAGHYFTSDRTKKTIYEKPKDLATMKRDELKKLIETIYSEVQTSVIRCDRPRRSAEHPTMKPIKLVAELMNNSSRPGHIVYDGFVGSGTTIITAQQLHRTCYAMELDPVYCAQVVDRTMKYDPKIPITKNGQPYRPRPLSEQKPQKIMQ